MTTPEPSTGIQNLAEKVARSYWERARAGVSWDQLPERFRDASVARTVEYLAAIQAAGLAVVELPEPDRRILCEDFQGRDATAPQWEMPDGERLTVFTDGVEDDAGLIEDLDRLRVPALKMLAAAAHCERYRAEHQGGESR